MPYSTATPRIGNGSSSSNSEAMAMGDAGEYWGRGEAAGEPKPKPQPRKLNRVSPAWFALCPPRPRRPVSSLVPTPTQTTVRERYDHAGLYKCVCRRIRMCVDAWALYAKIHVTEMRGGHGVYEIGMTEKVMKNSSLFQHYASDLLWKRCKSSPENIIKVNIDSRVRQLFLVSRSLGNLWFLPS